MELKAREVLSDCKDALAELNGTCGSIWRRCFITNVTLLRTVGHVLEKIDSDKSEVHQQVISERWNYWNSNKTKHTIFWNFIHAERNNILKEYQINAGQSATVYIGSGLIASHSIYDYPITDGYFIGMDQRDLILKAIQWWEKELNIIEDTIKKEGGKG